MALARAAAVPRPVCLFRAAPAQRFSSPAAVTAATAPPPPPDGGGGTGPRVLRVLLVGSPGAGKGTQSARIRNKFPFVAISSGDVLRKHIQSGTDVGRLAHEAMLKGEMVSDNVMVDLISSELASVPSTQHLLLDGFPRSMEQAKALDDKLDRDCQPLNLVINLHVPTDVILQRIMDRWVHVPSGRVYNTSYNPPRLPGYDDVTGERLVRRLDDDPHVFRVRMEKHLALTQPLLGYYEKRNILVSLSGSTSDEIYPQIEAEIVKRLLPSSATHRTGQSFADDPTAFPGPAPLPGPSAVADGVTASVSVVQLA